MDYSVLIVRKDRDAAWFQWKKEKEDRGGNNVLMCLTSASLKGK